MASGIAVDPDRTALTPVVFGSVIAHIVVLIIVPVLGSLLHRTKSFEHPRTFQVVRLPSAPQALPQVSAATAALEAKPKTMQPKAVAKPAATKPVPAKNRKSEKAETAKNREEAAPQEETDELAALLNELPAPAQVASLTGDFNYPWYLANVQEKIERSWNPPMKKEGVAVVVSFMINSEGVVSEPAIVSSCGIATLDNLALRAVKLAGPFGKLPPGFSGNSLSINCTLKPVGK